ncbi:Cytochrome P450 [Quillaja saponaria]|uniref:Cytochrome P450 n=1 Tax=Quillaja saponaria TaxID=32244 RepID=A0AAD7P546_QUISA|nr:Cytochrome P450 [Quillaja saponaria]
MSSQLFSINPSCLSSCTPPAVLSPPFSLPLHHCSKPFTGVRKSEAKDNPVNYDFRLRCKAETQDCPVLKWHASVEDDNVKTALKKESMEDVNGISVSPNGGQCPARLVSDNTVRKSQKLLPGPWKLPFIGNLHNLAGSLPHRALSELARKYGPVMHLQLGEISTVVVSSPATAKEVLRTQDVIFGTRPLLLASDILTYGWQGIAMTPTNDYWREMRKALMMELLTAKRVQYFSFIRYDMVNNLIESIRSSAGSPINLTKEIFHTVSSITCRAALGAQFKDQDEFIELGNKLFELSGGFDLADLFPSVELIHSVTGLKEKLVDIRQRSSKILDTVINEHKENRRRRAEEGKIQKEQDEDLVDILLRLQESGTLDIPITTESMKAVLYDVFAAGTDTSSVTVDWTMAELLRNPRVLKKLQAEIRQVFKGKKEIEESDIEKLSYLKLVLKETFRLHIPAPFLLPREATETCEIDGFEIPLKTQVLVNAWAIGRDPELWHNAESYEPERFINSDIEYKGNNFELLPFGAGKRMCPGITYGMANVELPLVKLLYHFNWQLPDGMVPEDVDMTELFGTTVSRKNSLRVVATPYND